MRDQGLLSRILVASPESIAGTRLYCDPQPSDEAAIRAYGARILSIFEEPPPTEKGVPNELTPRALPLSADATELWKQSFNQVEAQSGNGGRYALIRDFASKAGEHAARIAGVLTIVKNLRAEEIGLAEMENAVTLVNWYLGEAERLQSASRLDPKLLRASALLDWLRERDSDECSLRDILRLGPGFLRTKERADEAVGILIGHKWLSEISTRPRVFRLDRRQ